MNDSLGVKRRFRLNLSSKIGIGDLKKKINISEDV